MLTPARGYYVTKLKLNESYHKRSIPLKDTLPVYSHWFGCALILLGPHPTRACIHFYPCKTGRLQVNHVESLPDNGNNTSNIKAFAIDHDWVVLPKSLERLPCLLKKDSVVGILLSMEKL